jgi:hypothetical protein
MPEPGEAAGRGLITPDEVQQLAPYLVVRDLGQGDDIPAAREQTVHPPRNRSVLRSGRVDEPADEARIQDERQSRCSRNFTGAGSSISSAAETRSSYEGSSSIHWRSRRRTRA